MEEEQNLKNNVDKLLSKDGQIWLLGAGASLDSNLPLMSTLTKRVIEMFKQKYPGDSGDYELILKPLVGELRPDDNIELILSHIGDYSALAERANNKTIKIGNQSIHLDRLKEVHHNILKIISDSIRYGLIEADKEIKVGTKDNSLIDIKTHQEFIKALFGASQAGIADRKKPIKIFTTNYDTLIEDALALNQVHYWDGFSGGAVAHRITKYGDKLPTGNLYRAHVIKLHGSIDWYSDSEGHIWRVRLDDTYPKQDKEVLIYPQATKYTATQQDPFATQFDFFRMSLDSQNENTLITCGYSFHDEHINNEIINALLKVNNNTTLLAFVDQVPDCISSWRKKLVKGREDRIITISKNGIQMSLDEMSPHVNQCEWWKFKEVIEILKNGFGD